MIIITNDFGIIPFIPISIKLILLNQCPIYSPLFPNCSHLFLACSIPSPPCSPTFPTCSLCSPLLLT